MSRTMGRDWHWRYLRKIMQLSEALDAEEIRSYFKFLCRIWTAIKKQISTLTYLLLAVDMTDSLEDCDYKKIVNLYTVHV
jgi:hypothetical protein